MGMATSIWAVTSGTGQVMDSSQAFCFSPTGEGFVPRISSAAFTTASGSTSPTTHSSIFPGA